MMARVEWLQTAVNELANVWLNADSATRQVITIAARQIEVVLKVDPEEQGESEAEESFSPNRWLRSLRLMQSWSWSRS